MQKKNPIIGAILGLFLIGLPYSGGWKKGLIAFIGLTVVAVAANVMLGTALFSFVGAYLGYTWTNEYNAAIDAQGTETPTTL